LGLLRLMKCMPAPELRSDKPEEVNKVTLSTEIKQQEKKSILLASDVVQLAIDVITTPLDVRSSRELTLLLGNIEVIIRSDRLPISYMKAIASFCIGLLYTKFSSIWDPAMAVVRAASESSVGEKHIWPIILNSLEDLIKKNEDEMTSSQTRANSTTEEDGLPEDIVTQLELINSGLIPVSQPLVNSSYFYSSLVLSAIDSIHNEKTTFVEFDARTDSETIYLLFWKILELCPNITLRRSKLVVPIFLR
jgi:hypothetical protein